MTTFLKSDETRNIHDPIIQIEHDILGRKDLAQAILERLTKYDIAALGIYGGWGTGKTSLLNLLCQLNEDRVLPSHEKQLHVEVIDAWKYEAGENLLVPVIVRLKKIAGIIELPDAWKVITRRVLTTAALSATDAILKKFTGIDRKDIKAVAEEVVNHDKQKDYPSILLAWEDWADEIEATQAAFLKIVGFVLNRLDCKRIVICIDNLDRCSPENAVRLLESVKIFFSVPNFTWIFAMDSDVVASYINRKYEGTTMDGNSYLDKIIPEQYHLSFFPQENDARIYDLIRLATGRDLTLNDWKRLPLIPYVIVPRRLKKSAVKFAECFSGPDPVEADRDTVFLLSLLYHTWPDFYERLSSTLVNHVGGILANFFKNRKTEDVGWQWGDYSPSPLANRFVDNQELIQFLQTAFPDAKRIPTEVAVSIQSAMSALRRVGLP